MIYPVVITLALAEMSSPGVGVKIENSKAKGVHYFRRSQTVEIEKEGSRNLKKILRK